MPRQRRRRRRANQPARDRTQAKQEARRQGNQGRRHSPLPTDAGAPADSLLRPWWKPTLGIVFAFSFGLWLGGTLSLSDVLSAAALIGGAIGMGTALARLMGTRLREKRVERWRARQRFDDSAADAAAEDEYEDPGEQ